MKNYIIKSIINSISYKNSRRIIVFEVDDYGSTKIDFNRINDIKREGIPLRFFEENDRLSNIKELDNLFNVLKSVKDINGNNAIFSPYVVMANPDFQKIYNSNYKDYYYKPFYEAAEEFYNFNPILKWREGIDDKIFIPEFHCREHFNVLSWLKALKDGNSDAMKAFNYKSVILGSDLSTADITRFAAAFDLSNQQEVDSQKQNIITGLNMFEDVFGYKSEVFTPPDGYLNDIIDNHLVDLGIKSLVVSSKRLVPKGNKILKTKYYYLGKKKNRLRYLVRNCQFEPHSSNKSDWVDSCLSDIELAFKWNTPALISSHRINFLESTPIPSNNPSGIYQLNELLQKIIKKWPNVEFMSSRCFSNLIHN